MDNPLRRGDLTTLASAPFARPRTLHSTPTGTILTWPGLRSGPCRRCGLNLPAARTRPGLDGMTRPNSGQVQPLLSVYINMATLTGFLGRPLPESGETPVPLGLRRLRGRRLPRPGHPDRSGQGGQRRGRCHLAGPALRRVRAVLRRAAGTDPLPPSDRHRPGPTDAQAPLRGRPAPADRSLGRRHLRRAAPRLAFDVMLINPGGRDSRRPLLEELHARAGTDRRKTTVGLVGRGDWASEDWDLANAVGIRTYLNEQELADSVAFVAGSQRSPQG